MALLRLESIETGYRGAPVLKQISLSVIEGHVATLVGSNGAGKTTILRAISGIIYLYSGSIFFEDVRIDKKAAHEIVRLGVAHIPQGRQLFPKMTVEENLAMGAYTERAWQRQAEGVEHVYSLFPRLRERRVQLAGTLSGGEQQMLAIGRGLMSSPRILLCDEPSLGLAPMLVSKIFGAIEQINKGGITILLVEQNVRLALAIAHRGFVLENGRIAFEGSRNELIDDPRVKKAYLGG
jgi:branched-chain amino acid transport system ATP-binding protein